MQAHVKTLIGSEAGDVFDRHAEALLVFIIGNMRVQSAGTKTKSAESGGPVSSMQRNRRPGLAVAVR